jgi:LysR family transcriptional regulator, hydrogen peroxide-inducible genes activator
MEMHQVRYFLAVCETLNFTKAADQCHVSQPSLTRAVKLLEDELGGPLFHRERANTHLTDLGQAMKPYLEQISQANEMARSEAQGFKKLKRAPLRLGVMCTIGPRRLVPFFERLRAEIPTLEVQMTEAAGRRIMEELLRGSFDVAFVGLPAYAEKVHARPLYIERYVVTFRPGHRFEAMNAVPLRQLDGEDYLSRANCEYPEHFDAMGVPDDRAKVHVRYRSEREDWIQAMILAGMGCAVMPEYLPTFPGIASRIIIEPEIARTISLLTVAGRRHSPAIEVFMRIAQKHDWRA